MKKGFRDFVCLLALAVLLLALPAGSLADDEWSANWTSSTSSITYGGTITNGSAVLTAEYYYQTYTIFIEGVHADSGPLGDLVLPTEIDGCTSFIVSTRVFAGNDTLTSITATPSVTSIQPYAFQNCTNLIRADLSACKLTNVRNEIFRGCTSLETVILPSTITEIEAQAFKDCTSLNTVYILSETPPEISTDSFANCSSDLRIVSVNADVDEYPNVPGWSAYADKIVGASLLTASPASHAWTVQRHGTANAQTFTLTNEDGHNAEAIASLSVALAGANADAFTLSTDGMSASLNVGGSTRFTVTPKTDLSTGTYQATVQVTADGVVAATVPLTLNIEGQSLANAQVQVAGGDAIDYTGQEQRPAVTVTLNGTLLTENQDYTLSYSNNTNAGTATVTVTGTGDYSKTATGTFTIHPVTITLDSVTLQSKIYDGTTDATVESVGFTGLVGSETLASGTGYTAAAAFDSAAAGDGRTATVTVTLKTANYTFADGATAARQLEDQTIARRPVTITPDAKSKAYGQSDSELTYAASGLVSGDSLVGALSRAEGEDAGSHLIGQNTLTDANNPNYAITFDGTKALTIEQAGVDLSVTVTPASQKAGSPVTVTVTTQNAEANLMDAGWAQPEGDVTVTVGSDSISMTRDGDAWTGTYTVPQGTPAGDMTVSAAIAATTNYLEASKTVNLAVAEKGAVALTLTPSASAVTYGDAVTLTADVSKADSSDPDALTGDVRFYLDSVDAPHQLGEPQDVTGELSVTLDRAELTAGTHTVYAVYEGNSAFADRQTQIDIMVAARTLGWDASGLSASRSQAQAGEAEVHGTLRLTGRLDGDAVTLIPDTGLVTSGLAGVAQPGEYQVKVVPQSGAYALNNPNYALPDDGPVITAFVYASTEEDVPSTGSDRLKLVMEAGLSSVPASLAGTYASPAQLEAALRADVTALGVPGADVAIYDVTLMVSRDGGQSWSEVTESDFPASGITVTLPYPAGTGAQGYVFTVAHMFSSGANAGRIEHPTATATEKGVSFTVTGLSPVALGWTAGNYAVTLHPSGGTIAAGKDVTGYTYGVGAALPTAADVTRDGYTFDGWYDNAALTGSPVTVITTADVGNREYWAKWLSAGVGLKSVSVDGTAGVIDGTEISVVLPAGSSLPADAQQIAVTPADAQASVSMPVTADGGATWTFTVTAQDGTSRAYTLRITLAVALPQTGDASHVGLWMLLMLLSLGGLSLLALGRRRQGGER